MNTGISGPVTTIALLALALFAAGLHTAAAALAEPKPAETIEQAFMQALHGDSHTSRALREMAKAQAAVTPAQTINVDVTMACDLVRQFADSNPATACSIINQVATSLATFKAKCPNLTETGFGRQLQPPTVGIDGSSLPQPLTPRVGKAPVPLQYNETATLDLLKAEAGTYAWLWQVCQNLFSYYACSKDFGGNLDGYLLPTGWDPITVDGMMANNPGIYALKEADGASHPLMVMLKQPSTSHMVVALRPTGNGNEWIYNFQYNRTKKSTFSGKKFAKNKFPGEVHWGFFTVFQQLWPSVQAALDAHVIGGEKLGNVTITGHSLGSAVASLLGYASQAYLTASKSKAQLGMMVAGVPNFGNTLLRTGFAKTLNSRRVVFQYDFAPLLPCGSTSKTAAMPACTTDQVKVPTNFPAKVKYWLDYQPIPGTIQITTAMMAVQLAAWEKTRTIALDTAGSAPFPYAAHVCSYRCAFSGYVKAPEHTQCMLVTPTGNDSVGQTACVPP